MSPQLNIFPDASNLSRRFQHLRLINSTFNVLQIPWWVKRYDSKLNLFIMHDLNDVYESRFIIPNNFTKSDYIGSNDYLIWPHDVAKRFEEHDWEAFNARSTVVFEEQYAIRETMYTEIFLKSYVCDQITEEEFIVGVSLNVPLINFEKTDHETKSSRKI